MRGVVAYRSLYSSRTRLADREMAVLAVSPLLREIIKRMALWPWDKPEAEQTCTLALFMEELAQAPREPGSCHCQRTRVWGLAGR